LIEEFDIQFEYKRQLAEFINSVERLYSATEALREILARCSAYIKRANPNKIDPLVIDECRMSISDRYLLVKIIMSELNAHSNIDRIIEKILELLSKPN